MSDGIIGFMKEDPDAEPSPLLHDASVERMRALVRSAVGERIESLVGLFMENRGALHKVPEESAVNEAMRAINVALKKAIQASNSSSSSSSSITVRSENALAFAVAEVLQGIRVPWWMAQVLRWCHGEARDSISFAALLHEMQRRGESGDEGALVRFPDDIDAFDPQRHLADARVGLTCHQRYLLAASILLRNARTFSSATNISCLSPFQAYAFHHAHWTNNLDTMRGLVDGAVLPPPVLAAPAAPAGFSSIAEAVALCRSLEPDPKERLMELLLNGGCLRVDSMRVVFEPMGNAELMWVLCAASYKLLCCGTRHPCTKSASLAPGLCLTGQWCYLMCWPGVFRPMLREAMEEDLRREVAESAFTSDTDFDDIGRAWAVSHGDSVDEDRILQLLKHYPGLARREAPLVDAWISKHVKIPTAAHSHSHSDSDPPLVDLSEVDAPDGPLKEIELDLFGDGTFVVRTATFRSGCACPPQGTSLAAWCAQDPARIDQVSAHVRFLAQHRPAELGLTERDAELLKGALTKMSVPHPAPAPYSPPPAAAAAPGGSSSHKRHRRSRG